MEVDSPTIPQSVIDDEQHTMYYYQALPYAHLLDLEAKEWLDDIVTNLIACIKARDFSRGVAFWTKHLSLYRELKHDIPRDTRATLAKLLYTVVTIPGMDITIVESCANMCVRLIRKTHRLGPEDLTLPWKPLYEALDRFIFGEFEARVYHSEKHINAVVRLADHAQRFFPPSATKEVLDTFLPMFSVDSMKDVAKTQGYLVLFLPSTIPRHSITNERLPGGESAIHPKEYLPTLFSMWSIITASSTYDSQFITQLANIAEANIDDPSIDDTGLFTREQIKAVFTVGLQMMSIPVGSKDGSGIGGGRRSGSTGYGSNGRKNDIKAGDALLLRGKLERYRSLAKFIIYSIIPENEDGASYVLTLLEELVQATELYYHPSNYGTWSFYLTLFMHHVAEMFLKRWQEEEESSCNTPSTRRLTPALRKRFVLIIRPLTYLSIFGKDSFIVRTTQKTLKYLCWLEPNLIFPGLLERIYPSLETLTEAPRDHYAAGGKHLLPLLDLATPGIDMNDPIKSVITMLFINAVVALVPVSDLTTGSSGYDNGYGGGIDYEGMDIDPSDPEAQLPREEEDRLCKTSTGVFEDWMAKFLRRVFAMVFLYLQAVVFQGGTNQTCISQLENLPQQNRTKNDGAYETGLTTMVMHTCDTLFGQLSDDMYNLALRMVVDFVGGQVLSNAIHAGGLLCTAIASADPAKAAKHLIPLCIGNIMSELEHGAASTIVNSATSTPIQSDSTLHWYQGILFSTVAAMGSELLNYKTEIINVLKEMTEKCKSRTGFTWSGKLLRASLKTLLAIYPREFRSLTPKEWNSKECMAKSHLLWGKPGDPKDLQIDWHVPTKEEIDFGMELLETFVVPSMNQVRELISDYGSSESSMATHEWTNLFCRHLSLIRNGLMGSTCLIPCNGFEPENEADYMDDDNDIIYHLEHPPKFSADYPLNDPQDPTYQRARQLRKDIIQLTHEAIQFFQSKREDDLESLKVIIKISRTLVDDQGIDKKGMDGHSARYTMAHTMYKTPLGHKHYPRGILVHRAYLLHLRRLRTNVKMNTHASVLGSTFLRDLLDLSLSSYAEIRKLSQSTLNAALRNFGGARKEIVPLIVDVLEPKEKVDKDAYANKMKGALYLLQQKNILSPCIHRSDLTPKFVLSICKAQHEDKPSIQELIRKLFVNFISSSAIAAVLSRILVPEDDDRYLDQLAQSDKINSLVEAYKTKVESTQHKRQESYDDMISSLLDLLEDPKLHWRFSTMAANVIQVFTRPDTAPTARMASFAIKSALSELSPMRRIGVSVTIQLLQYIEDRTLAQGDSDKLISKDIDDPLEREVHVSQDLAQNPLVDEPCTGWYVWPDKFKGRTLRPATSDDRDIDEASKKAYDEFEKSFTSTSFWESLSKYMSQELSQAEEDLFNRVNVNLYENIFIIYEDKPLPAMQEQLEKLCGSMEQRSHQRAAAEMITGLVRGTVNWPLVKIQKLWEWLAPLLQSTFAAITPDSLTYWESCVKHCAVNWDPRRLHYLRQVVFGATFDPTSDAAFAEARKLLLARAMISELGWRGAPLVDGLLHTYFGHLAHPYKQVRECLGSNINEILQFHWAPSMLNVKEAIEKNQQSDIGGVGNVPMTLDNRTQALLDTAVQQLDQWQANDIESYKRASKTVLCWLHDALRQWRVECVLPYVVSLWKRIVSMQELHDDPDLQAMASSVLNALTQFVYPPAMVEKLLEEFIAVLTKSESWRIRTRTLPMLQVFFFRNLFNMTSDQIVRVMSVVGGLLLNAQIEVRQMAAITLGGLVRCSQRDAIESVQAQYSALLQTKVAKRRRDPETGKLIEIPGFDEAVLKKHAGVLGLSCLVGAFPYEVPKWMPNVLCQLASCMSDPAEIQATVRKTFSDFRRTHSDTWHEDITKFTEDQLSILNDMLISPSYYA
ncbi:hypothetical protein LRAMOSA06388 [Lichtheimia ramosa]|uniref:Proteasome activator subunit 4 n=1 Tax=Lichtheimia ramosa TaxID=688394 RepID=A0A077X4I5_9FUNG|nr:hypothetical protein LRAMOSA06388 [Lichtheimia ramosa]